LDLQGQYQKLRAVFDASHFAQQLHLRGEFDVTDANLFAKLNAFRPHVVHVSGNQNGGDVLLPSATGGEVVVADVALAGLLSPLGPVVRLTVIYTCKLLVTKKRIPRLCVNAQSNASRIRLVG
jgi:hypothetical protein